LTHTHITIQSPSCHHPPISACGAAGATGTRAGAKTTPLGKLLGPQRPLEALQCVAGVGGATKNGAGTWGIQHDLGRFNSQQVGFHMI